MRLVARSSRSCCQQEEWVVLVGAMSLPKDVCSQSGKAIDERQSCLWDGPKHQSSLSCEDWAIWGSVRSWQRADRGVEKAFEACGHPGRNLHFLAGLSRQCCVSAAYPQEMECPFGVHCAASLAAVRSVQLEGSRWTEHPMGCHICGWTGLVVYWKAGAEVEATESGELRSV